MREEKADTAVSGAKELRVPLGVKAVLLAWMEAHLDELNPNTTGSIAARWGGDAAKLALASVLIGPGWHWNAGAPERMRKEPPDGAEKERELATRIFDEHLRLVLRGLSFSKKEIDQIAAEARSSVETELKNERRAGAEKAWASAVKNQKPFTEISLPNEHALLMSIPKDLQPEWGRAIGLFLVWASEWELKRLSGTHHEQARAAKLWFDKFKKSAKKTHPEWFKL